MRNAQQEGGGQRDTEQRGMGGETHSRDIEKPTKEMHNRSGNKETHKKLNTNTYTV